MGRCIVKLVISNGIALAKHLDSQDILSHYPGCTIVSVEDGTTVETGRSWTVTLEATQATACSRIDATAEALCSNLITPGQTQQTRYARKLAQAEAFLQDGTPTAAEYPLIYNEVGITASNAGAVAMAVVQAAEAYDTFCDQVELVRAKAKGAVCAASNASLVASAEAAVAWPVTG